MASAQPHPGDVAPARVFLRPVGSPLTIGMSGLAVGSLLQSGLDLHWIAATQRHELGFMLLSLPFLLPLIASVFSYLARDGAAGAALGVLSGTWLALALSHITSTPPSRSGALGLLLLASGGVLACSAVAIALPKPLPGLVFGLAASRFILGGIYQLGAGDAWRDAGGIVGLVVCGLAAYGVLAFELEGEKHRPLLPTFRRGVGRSAVMDGAGAQVDGVVNEPGVRQTT
jgi:hypothetical protein